MHAAAVHERQSGEVKDDLLDVGCLDRPQLVFDAMDGGDVKLTGQEHHVRGVIARRTDRELTGRQRIQDVRMAARVEVRRRDKMQPTRAPCGP
jgi:hypothetical protein